MTPAIRGRLRAPCPRAGQKDFADKHRVGSLPPLRLQTQQEGGDAGNQGSRAAASAHPLRTAARPGTQDMLSRSQNGRVIALIDARAEIERLALVVHCPDREDRVQSCRNVQTALPLVPRRGNDQDSLPHTIADHIG